MKKYEKPVMQVVRYTMDHAVATGCYEETTTAFPAQNVSCIINGSENIFEKSQAGSACVNDVDSGKLGIYNGEYYFVWYNGSVVGSPTKEQTAKLSEIERAVGYSSAVGKPGYHAGKVTAEQYKQMNSTS